MRDHPARVKLNPPRLARYRERDGWYVWFSGQGYRLTGPYGPFQVLR